MLKRALGEGNAVIVRSSADHWVNRAAINRTSPRAERQRQRGGVEGSLAAATSLRDSRITGVYPKSVLDGEFHLARQYAKRCAFIGPFRSVRPDLHEPHIVIPSLHAPAGHYRGMKTGSASVRGTCRVVHRSVRGSDAQRSGIPRRSVALAGIKYRLTLRCAGGCFAGAQHDGCGVSDHQVLLQTPCRGCQNPRVGHVICGSRTGNRRISRLPCAGCARHDIR